MTLFQNQSSSPASLCLLCQTPTTASPHRVFGTPVCSLCLRRHASNKGNRSEWGASDGLPMFSVEFEVRGECSFEAERALILLSHGYLRTHDCTVDDEYKSPRYRSLAAFQPVLPVFDQLSDLVNPMRCGTHIHVDCPVQREVGASLWRIFGPLADYLQHHPAETNSFWGRYSSHALASISDRYPTLEFRKPCFRTSAQYLAVVQFCRQVGHHLDGCLNESNPTYFPGDPELIGDDLLTLYHEAVAKASARQEVASYV